MYLPLSPIGYLNTPFIEKFGVPRQSLMIKEAKGWLKLNPDRNYHLALRHLDQFSHVWLIFLFHQAMAKPWQALIETPRVEVEGRMGVFATRSPHRPNPIGMSALKLDRIDFDAPGGIEVHVSGLDLLHGTPVLDIKPYLPFADRIEQANSGWVQSEIRQFPVVYLPESLAVLAEQSAQRHPRLKELLTEILSFDPRPTSQRRASPIGEAGSEGMNYAFRLLDLDVHWHIEEGALVVDSIKLLA